MSNVDLLDIKTQYSHCKRIYSGKLAPRNQTFGTSLTKKNPKTAKFWGNRFATRRNQKQGL